MRPLSFTCEITLTMAAAAVAEQILDLKRWPDFRGWGPLPGISKAEFAYRSPTEVSTRIHVLNRDGSRHAEEILEWQPDQRVQLVLQDFTRPVSWLATHFVETWDFRAVPQGTHVRRSFSLFPRSPWARPVLCLIAWLLKRAVARHLEDLKQAG